MSAAMLTDPKAMKKHLAIGTPSSHSESSFLPPRQSSEPISSATTMSLTAPFDSRFPKLLSKDDAYQVFEEKSKKASSGGHFPSSQPTARQLLDPKGFNNIQRQQESRDAPREPMMFTYQASTPYNLQMNGGPPEVNGNGNGNVDHTSLHKRDYDDYEGKGMGGLIERVHNISQREERPQKKQKSETFEEDDKEKQVASAGGGKGGEIGEYMRQKKKEGLEESGSVSAIVDLTGCTSSCTF